MAITTILLLSLARQTPTLASQTLYEVPARFEMGCPVLSLDMASESKGRQSVEFLLDSGATRSMLLNRKEGEERTYEQGKRGLLIPGVNTLYAGYQDFAAPNLGQFNQDLFDRIARLRVQGILGEDFLSVHDVLIDYGAQRVYLSRPIGAGEKTRFGPTLRLVGTAHKGGALTRHYIVQKSRANEVQISLEGRKLYLDAALVHGHGESWRMRFDTWATRSTIPEALASSLKRTGATEHVSAAGLSFDAEQVEATISIGSGAELNLRPVATDAAESILGSDALQDRTILLQVGGSRLRIWSESLLSRLEQSSRPGMASSSRP